MRLFTLPLHPPPLRPPPFRWPGRASDLASDHLGQVHYTIFLSFRRGFRWRPNQERGLNDCRLRELLALYNPYNRQTKAPRFAGGFYFRVYPQGNCIWIGKKPICLSLKPWFSKLMTCRAKMFDFDLKNWLWGQKTSQNNNEKRHEDAISLGFLPYLRAIF